MEQIKLPIGNQLTWDEILVLEAASDETDKSKEEILNEATDNTN